MDAPAARSQHALDLLLQTAKLHDVLGLAERQPSYRSNSANGLWVKVQFRWKDYRNGHRQKTMTLGADEFIRRFLLHVLPDGFQRIRYFGFLANRYRAEKLALCRQLMQMSPPTATRKVSMDYRDRYEVLTGVSLKTCPLSRCGAMVVIETFECATNPAPIIDTS